MTEEAKPREPFKYAPKTDAELEKLAWDIVGHQVFGTWSHPEAGKMCFLVLMFIDEAMREEMRKANIVHVYEYIDKAGPRSVNGLPMFMSMQMIDKNDTERLRVRIEQIEAFKSNRTTKEKQ